jgi:hypothetical protein
MTTKIQFGLEWRNQFNAKKFDFTNPNEQEAFITGIQSLLGHLIHTCRQGQIFVLPEGSEDISTVFIKLDGFKKI